MPERLKIAGLAIGALLWGAAGARAQDVDVEGGKDHPLISRYPGSVMSRYSMKQFDEYDLLVARASSAGTPEKSQHLEGKVTLILYTSPEERSALEVYRNYEGALTRAGFTPLFSCRGQEGPGSCGPMGTIHSTLHNWGGFEEDQQRYLAARLTRAAGEVFVALYVDPRYAVLDVVEVKPMEGGLVTVSAAALANDITRSGHASVYGIYFDTGKWDVKPESDATLREIAQLLQQNRAYRLHVVGHTDNVGDIAMNLDLSQKRAVAVVQALDRKSVV